ncbi:MAG TPA: 2-C-methyl-D-erythritol 2,4-cyclodiphosphate synthase [Gemmatimonadaceae bacterium]|jgi:2-C-methyl-D-erythritol 2,4-cyclodiphosphate synthase
MPPEAASATRTGIGYDSHPFTDSGPMVLGGVTIEGSRGLAGHSDGDAIAHALTDAVLGAAAEEDIGMLYPDSDPANRGRNSLEMLAEAVERIRGRGWRIANVDVVVITEEPRIAAHRARIRTGLAQALRVGEEAVSVKGKTNERMGWIGRGEGLACIAVATLSALPPDSDA